MCRACCVYDVVSVHRACISVCMPVEVFLVDCRYFASFGLVNVHGVVADVAWSVCCDSF